ncbi:MAG: hypothetical protein JSU00_19600 [Acidobacteria bacterium]|mgnify:FL=1|nr:hypothetical protein [Acidobacteriota bacterium]
MNRTSIIGLLMLAALLEAGGDAVIRTSLKASGVQRAALLALGTLVLGAYGYAVNSPPWDFGRLLGLYVVFFFIAAQAISWIGFRQPPSMAVLAGGALIVLGGVIIAYGES